MSIDAVRAEAPTARKLSTLDRWLPLWIGLAMVGGLLLAQGIPGISAVLASLEIGADFLNGAVVD